MYQGEMYKVFKKAHKMINFIFFKYTKLKLLTLLNIL